MSSISMTVISSTRPANATLMVSENSVSRWVKVYRERHPEVAEGSLTISERERLRGLEREVRVLREENEILGKATAFFAKKHR